MKSLIAIAVVIFSSLQLHAQNLVQDPGFELSSGVTGSPGGFSAFWTLSPPTSTGSGQQLSNVGTNPAFAHSGTKHANLEFSAGMGSTASLFQTLATVAGQTYTMSFWLANFVSLPTNLFQVLINGIVLSTNFGTTIGPGFPNDGVYRQVFATFTATGSSSNLEFRYHHDQDYWYLDDISVVSAPESGATLWLALPLFAALFAVHRLRTLTYPARPR